MKHRLPRSIPIRILSAGASGDVLTALVLSGGMRF